MSKYTTEVRFICETLAGKDESKGYTDVASIISSAKDSIFDFDYPIFDEDYRSVLETKIIKHYYTREIGLESYGLWKLKLDTKMNEIMPYFNKLYESALLEFNPLYDVDLKRTHNTIYSGGSTDETENAGASKSKLSTTDASRNKNIDLYSETPQGALSEDDLFTSETGATYLTTADKSTNDSNRATSSDNDITTQNAGISKKEFNNVTEYLEAVSGKTAGKSFSSMLKEYRETFLNIDMMIIDSLGELFITLW